MNPYGPCIANITTTCREQMTVIWHIDDLMGLCVDDFELMKFSCYLAKNYGPKLSMHMSNKHGYLGVDLKFNEDGTLIMSIINYLKNVIAEFPEMITGKAATLAANHLFTMRDKAEANAIEEERALAYHHTVAQLLFMVTRAILDI